MSQSKTTPVADPTWYSDIRYLFTQTDIDHMKSQSIDLTSYTDVVAIAENIYGQVATDNMPPGNPWSQAWKTTFLNWMKHDYPKGQPPSLRTTELLTDVEESSATRKRKEITTLSSTELDTLKKAFSGIMAKNPSDSNSYFVQAGYHWLPVPTYCEHHAPAYNPWHRVYLLSFENALRSIPGCENVTLPYWDITTPFPEVLKTAPFDSYTLPQDISEEFKAGYVTQRNSYPEIQKNLKDFGVTEDINRALTKTDWEDFHGFWSDASHNTIIAAHDSGHNSIGPTMANQSVAAFDPIFWFFHANWDRLFWKWQTLLDATSLNGLLSTINKSTDPVSYQIFTIPALQNLTPFTSNPPKLNTVSIIDSKGSLDVDYEDPVTFTAMEFLAKTQRSTAASHKFSVHTDHVNVRVQGLNRLKIPGSFNVHLLKNGKRIASRALFQPVEAEKCENCVSNAIVHFDFELPLETVLNGELEVVVEPIDKSFVGDRFPHKLMGNPTIDIHLLLKTE
ncbi:tyrosinase family protein [Leptolyngbya sp. PCC 7375]|nr:tyrosinase family protein [Leptolyngbya sp. PCC 7375]